MGPSKWRRMLWLFAFATFVEVIAYGQLAAFTPLHLPRLGVASADVAVWVGVITAGASAFGLLFLRSGERSPTATDANR